MEGKIVSSTIATEYIGWGRGVAARPGLISYGNSSGSDAPRPVYAVEQRQMSFPLAAFCLTVENLVCRA